MAVLLRLAPTRLIVKHVEDVALLSLINLIQSLVQVAEFEQTWWYKVIFDALVLKVTIHRLD